MKSSAGKLSFALIKLLVAIAILGCTRRPTFPSPTTYPAKGHFEGAKQPPEGTIVQLEPADPNLRAQGIVDKEGRFSLFVISHSERYEGATQGSHNVTVVYPLDANRDAGTILYLPEAILIEPHENNFTIKLP